jgi:hypothetical protein
VVDLTRTPLPKDLLVRLAGRIIDIHAIAREWNPIEQFTETVVGAIVDSVVSGPFFVSRARLLASCMANFLEIAEQNKEQSVDRILSSTIQSVHGSLAAKPLTSQWE